VILELFGLERPSLGVHDVDRQVEHVLWDFLIIDSVEILVLSEISIRPELA